ncbi:MAG: sulfite exporter TauE/SafE family protein [Saprospiraceae bacterium]|nr:sulfite exporter TauE/SafE family protein [Saprospiraceae bacterium]
MPGDQMSWFEIIIAISGGFLAGVINTLSGNGSIITLGLMTEFLGMPPQIANGTNRIGLLSQGVFSLLAFKKMNKLEVGNTKPYILTGIIGAIAGAITAVYISPDFFNGIYKLLMVLMLILIIAKPEKWLSQHKSQAHLSAWIHIPLFFILGFYGGFIQLGMGVFFIFIMTYLLNFDIIKSNIIKIIMVSSYTILIILIFQWNQMIDWKVGLTIAIGQSTGGYLMAHFSSRMKNLEKFVYYLFIGVVSLTLCKMVIYEYL